MFSKQFMRWLTVFVMAVMSSLVVMGPGMAGAQDDSTPEAVVESFYSWYLDYASYDAEAGTRNNPLVDGAYQDRPELSAAFIEEMAALIAEEPLNYDPFLCAQDVPQEMQVEPISGGEDAASVLVMTYFGSPRSNNLTVSLDNIEGEWQINGVVCGETVTPRGVVEHFYNWYISYARFDEEAGTRNNPLMDGAYRDYPYLTAELVEQVDAMVEDGLPFDPFTCAQDVPVSAWAEAVDVGDESAIMRVVAYFQGSGAPSELAVRLVLVDEQWMIDSIACGIALEERAGLFFNQYAAFARYAMTHDMEGINWFAMAFSDSMTDTLFDGLNALLTGDEPLPADPVLCAQDIPERFEVEVLSLNAETAVLQVSGLFPSGPETFDSYPLLEAEMVLTDERWLLAGIICEG